MAGSEMLMNWAVESIGRDRYPYFLIDGAQQEGSHKWLEKWGIAYVSLFDGEREAALREIAPLLIPVGDLDDIALERVSKWAVTLGIQFPCLSWIESSAPIQVLSAHLRHFHTVGVSDGQRIMLRWYDTRILPIWLACLETEQLQQFAGTLYSVNFLNRFGMPVAAFESEAPGEPSTALPLGAPLVTLNDRQLSMLIDSSELDTLMAHLRQVITDETNRVETRTLYEFVGKYQQRAMDAGLDDIDRQTQYLLLALYTSGHGVEHAACQALLDAPASSSKDFYDAMQSLPEEVWFTGPALWEMNEPRNETL